jgi:hypothetical protein
MKRNWLLSACAILSVSSSGCVSGPRVSPCLLDPANGVSYCAPAQGGDAVELPVAQMDNFTCFSPDDTQTLVEWIKRRSRREK